MKRFAKLLHPEIVLGLKPGQVVMPSKMGSPPVTEKQIYAYAHAGIAYDEVNGYTPGEAYMVQWQNSMTPSQWENFCITQKFKIERPPVYHAGKEFCKALQKMEPVIPVDLLPQRFFAYFSFPDGTVLDNEGDQILGIYVFVGEPKETPLLPELWSTSPKVFWAVYYTVKGDCARILMDLNERKTFKELAEHLPVDRGGTKTDVNIFALAMNLVLYVNSVDCDLHLAPPNKDMKPAEKKARQARGETINQCLLPVIYVSWNYQKPRLFHVDHAWVDTHLRWQRCGPNYSQVKLIWVKAHERTYKHDEETDVR